jgi:hypothetical protein
VSLIAHAHAQEDENEDEDEDEQEYEDTPESRRAVMVPTAR